MIQSKVQLDYTIQKYIFLVFLKLGVQKKGWRYRKNHL